MNVTRGERLSGFYRSTALIVLNTLILFTLLNLAAYPFLSDDEPAEDPPVFSRAERIDALRTFYPDLNEDEINDFFRETWWRPYGYESFTQFREQPHRGEFVNVHDAGFRVSKNQGPWPPSPDAFNLFLFGGSTTFGYGVPDDQTIASHLQDTLRERFGDDVNVYNFGRGHYYSTQERILFEKLLAAGHVPDVAVFVDGLNDFYYNGDQPLFTPRFAEFVSEAATQSRPSIIERLPLVRVFRQARHPPPNAPAGSPETYDDPDVIRAVVARYLANKKMIEAVASSFGVRAGFAWQPVPTYRYEQRHHMFGGRGFGRHTYTRYGYAHVETLAKTGGLGAGFLWCAGIQESRQEALYLDRVHYTPAFSRDVATCIADLLLTRELVR